MKGFKSFASATHLRLEPGITCIVGPNGSGKSNVVDALAWVMGEQGAKSLRGGSMEDVIFAGTAGRPPLGRAEVALTIDNTDGALPIDYTEVTISRTMFRSGGSEYAINGTSCRLLDIQELLSDSGIGREMHVIVGQGQLDAVLRATPEERRGFIEEAAGVLKHRKRKERALRKLESMEANLTRITDLTGEIRRQLGPLGRQAETARKAAVIQAEVRDARLRVLADDLVQLTSTLEQEVADETALIARRTEVEDGLTGLGSRVAELESAAEAARPELSQAQDRWYALARLTERLTATGSLATERVRLLRQDLADEARDAGSGASSRDPEELRRQAAELLHQHEALVVEIADATAALEAAVAQRADRRAGLRGGAAAPRPRRPCRRRPPRGPGPARRSGRRQGLPYRGGGGRDRPDARDGRRRASPGRPGRARVRRAGVVDRRRGGRRGGPRRGLRAGRRPPRPAPGRARGAPGGRALRGARPAVVHGPRGRARHEPASQGRGGRVAGGRGRHAYDRRFGGLARAGRGRPRGRGRRRPGLGRRRARRRHAGRRRCGGGPASFRRRRARRAARRRDRRLGGAVRVAVAPERGAMGGRRRVVLRPATPGGRPTPRAGGARRQCRRGRGARCATG